MAVWKRKWHWWSVSHSKGGAVWELVEIRKVGDSDGSCAGFFKCAEAE